jgi:hypothetical protein
VPKHRHLADPRVGKVRHLLRFRPRDKQMPV